jgi:hypothetical protein
MANLLSSDFGAANKGSLAAIESLPPPRKEHFHDDSVFAGQGRGEGRTMRHPAEAEGVLCG